MKQAALPIWEGSFQKLKYYLKIFICNILQYLN